MGRRLDDVRLAVLMIDGIDLKGRTNVVALGISDRRDQDPARALGRLDRERRGRDRAALRPGRPRPRRRAGGALRPRRRQGAPQGRPRRARDDTPVQRCIRHKERNVCDHLPERDRPAVKQRLRLGLGDSTTTPRPRAAPSARRRARAHPPRRRRLAARGPRGDAHPAAARDPRQSEADARFDQPVRVDDRVRPPHQPQRQALAVRRHGAPLDSRRHARSRTPIPQVIGYRDLAKLALAIERDLARTNHPVPDRGGRYPRHCLNVTPGPPSRSSTTNGTSSIPATGISLAARHSDVSTTLLTGRDYTARAAAG